MEKSHVHAKQMFAGESAGEQKTLWGMVAAWYHRQKDYTRGTLMGMAGGVALGLYITTFLSFWDVLVVIAGAGLAAGFISICKRIALF